MPTKRKLSSIKACETALAEQLAKLAEAQGSPCYRLLMGDSAIKPGTVDDVFDELQADDYQGCTELTVVLHSSGGDIDAAYNLATTFRRIGSQRLVFVIPRWAKSAATLIACAGDEILMSPVAEMGPLDPQIMQFNPFESRVEHFSPLHIDATLKLIRDEFEKGNAEFAKSLVERLQFPLTLGSFKQSLELSKQYLEKLLSTRMLKHAEGQAEATARRLSEAYADHGFCINLEEAVELGLTAKPIPDDQLQIAWAIHEVDKRRTELIKERDGKKALDMLKDIPHDALGAARGTAPRQEKS